MYYNPIAWANTTVFDFKSQLKTGAMTLFLWTYADDMLTDDFFHPLGTVVSNPKTNYTTTLTLTFDRFVVKGCSSGEAKLRFLVTDRIRR